MNMNEGGKGFIPEEKYKEILSLVPVPCVDIVITHGSKFFLGKRANKPNQGEWFIFGGRVHKGETLVDAARRKLRVEVGLHVDPSQLTILTGGEVIHEDSAFEGVASHTVGVILRLDLDSEPEVNVDRSESLEVKWFSKIDPSWHSYVKHALRTAGFSE